MTTPVNPTPRRWATKREAAQHAGGYTERTIDRWIKEKRWPSYRVWRNIRIFIYVLERLIESNAA
jgi:hypothetical protein